MKTLIADDDGALRMALRQRLEEMGHEVVSAEDGERAWELLQAEHLPLVILDWIMPGLDGLELCRNIRARGDEPSYTYVILLTARSDPEDRVVGLEAGADDFLTKKLDPGELLARLGVARRILNMQEDLRRRTRELEVMHSELQRQYARLAEVAVSDGLTGLKNRRHFRESLDAAFAFSRRRELPLSVVMVDVDHFKQYNDSFGHPAGDAALTDFGRLLRDNVRSHDLVARYGGEEFVMLLPATDAPSGLAFCNRLRGLIEAHPWPLRPITASFGVSTVTTRTRNSLQLVEEADRALYVSKNRGRNRASHFEESLQTAV